MKTIFCLSAFIFLSAKTFSQNVGIGTSEPLNKLQVTGSILANVPIVATNTAPTGAQTKTMVNGGFLGFLSSDSVGRIYDPGGPAGNYLPNNTAQVEMLTSTCVGYEVIAETMDLGTGDSLFIRESPGGPNLVAVGNGYTTIGKWTFTSYTLAIIFKSNGDGSTGAGFSLLLHRLYENGASLPAISGYMGKGFYFDAKNGALRTGFSSNAVRGDYSTAMGYFNSATGNSSVAMGFSSESRGDASVALGFGSDANGPNCFAMGNQAYANGNTSAAIGFNASATGDYSFATGYYGDASGDYSTALGGATASGNRATAIGGNTASGDFSIALGRSNTASGNNSTAMGYLASTNGLTNSFCIGGTGTATTCTSPNQFMTRFDNYTFWISASNYAYMLPSTNGWTYTSDRNKKERFEELNGETVLKKISNIPFCSWSFKAADTRQYRHYGMAAQDFYNAFGKDSYGFIGNDTTVSPLDLLGVAYSAIKALEKRTTDQQEQNKQAIKENDNLRADNLALQKRLTQLETKMNELLAIKEKEEPVKNGMAVLKTSVVH